MTSQGTINAIETRYAGCRFRSRLEARWAVFFDALNIEWRYEDQGYEIDGQYYLPDFYLPRWRLFVEVKGDASQVSADYEHTLYRLAELVDQDIAFGVAILGPIPVIEKHKAPLHSIARKSTACTGSDLERTEGVTLANFYFLGHGYPLVLADWFSKLDKNNLVDHTVIGGLYIDPRVEAAYTAASEARFEHGESGRGVRA